MGPDGLGDEHVSGCCCEWHCWHHCLNEGSLFWQCSACPGALGEEAAAGTQCLGIQSTCEAAAAGSSPVGVQYIWESLV